MSWINASLCSPVVQCRLTRLSRMGKFISAGISPLTSWIIHNRLCITELLLYMDESCRYRSSRACTILPWNVSLTEYMSLILSTAISIPLGPTAHHLGPAGGTRHCPLHLRHPLAYPLPMVRTCRSKVHCFTLFTRRTRVRATTRVAEGRSLGSPRGGLVKGGMATFMRCKLD